MLRLLLFVLCLVLGAAALFKLVRAVQRRQWDWPGVAFAIGFVLLAIYLRNMTGIGGSFG
jgi:uncharacterized BrkB/YihY/UPF0761 family membrane protein